ncbi:MAG: hypothetical protein ACI9DK_000466 [Vicingaceae bacterium]|jgi:hypothetical protein
MISLGAPVFNIYCMLVQITGISGGLNLPSLWTLLQKKTFDAEIQTIVLK